VPRVYTKKTHCIRGHELSPENRVNGTGQCKLCRLIHRKDFEEKNPDYCRNWKKENKERLRTEHIGSRYGLTQERYDEMRVEQNNCCGVCGVVFDTTNTNTTPHVDHNHLTGKVRELLCRACNSGLGQFRDNSELLRKAANYLDKHTEEGRELSRKTVDYRPTLVV